MTELWRARQLVEDAIECLEDARREIENGDLDWPALSAWYEAIASAEKVVRAVEVPGDILSAIKAHDEDDREPIQPGDYHLYDVRETPEEGGAG